MGQKKDPTEIVDEKVELLQKWSQTMDVVCAHSPEADREPRIRAS